MAAAACGSPGVAGPGSRSGELTQQAGSHRRNRGTDSRRRQAALFFLNNISLDGRPLCPVPQQAWEAAPPKDGFEPTVTCLSPSPRIPSINGPRIILPRDPAEEMGKTKVGFCTPSPAIRTVQSLGIISTSTYTGEKLSTKPQSESPQQSVLKKVHFIKNMKQYDIRNGRIVLICGKRSLCGAFSVLPYGECLRISDLRVEGTRQRHPSGGVPSASDPVFGMEGVVLGAEGQIFIGPLDLLLLLSASCGSLATVCWVTTLIPSCLISINGDALLFVVSYAKFLYPTNALVSQKSEGHAVTSQNRASTYESAKRNFSSTRFSKVVPGTEIDIGETVEYNPNILDDPQWPCGKHKRVLIFASYMTTIIEYVKPSDLKKDMNETFKEKFPYVKLTLSKSRSLKREMRNVARECNLEPVTVAMSYVYFEKLVLQGKVNKQNRKLCAGACVLLAAKISSDFKKPELKHLLDKLEERFRTDRLDLVAFELTVLVAMELALYLPESQVLPHFRRLTKQQ